MSEAAETPPAEPRAAASTTAASTSAPRLASSEWPAYVADAAGEVVFGSGDGWDGVPLPPLDDPFDEEADERAEAADEARVGLTPAVKDWFSLCAAIELEDQPYDPAYGRRVVWRVPARPSRAAQGFVPVEQARAAMATALAERTDPAAEAPSGPAGRARPARGRRGPGRPQPRRSDARRTKIHPAPGSTSRAAARPAPGMLLASGRVPRPEEWDDTIPGGLLATALDLWDPNPPRPEHTGTASPTAAATPDPETTGDRDTTPDLETNPDREPAPDLEAAGGAIERDLPELPELVEVPAAACGPGAGDPAVCIDVMRQARRVAAWAESRVLTAIAALAAARPPVEMPSTARARGRWAETAAAHGISEFVVDEVAAALSISRAAAVHYVIFALAATTRLPALTAALAAGRLDLPRARAVVEETEVLDTDTAREVCDRLLPAAMGMSPARFTRALTEAVLAADPAAAAARHAKAVKSSKVTIEAAPDGMGHLDAYLRADHAVAIWTTVDLLAATRATPGDGLSADQRRAAALTELVLTHPYVTGHTPHPRTDTHAASGTSGGDPGGGGHDAGEPPGSISDPPGSTDPSRHPAGSTNSDEDGPRPRAACGCACTCGWDGPVLARDRVLVQLTVPAATTTGALDLPAMLTGFGPIPADLARQIAADATWRRILTDPVTGTVTDVGRTRYRPPQALEDLIRAKHPTCRGPMCQTPSTRCDLDHTIAFPHGPTAEHNLGPWCRPEHRAKTFGPIRIVRDDDAFIWILDTGHIHRRDPDPLGPTLEQLTYWASRQNGHLTTTEPEPDTPEHEETLPPDPHAQTNPGREEAENDAPQGTPVDAKGPSDAVRPDSDPDDDRDDDPAGGRDR